MKFTTLEKVIIGLIVATLVWFFYSLNSLSVVLKEVDNKFGACVISYNVELLNAKEELEIRELCEAKKWD